MPNPAYGPGSPMYEATWDEYQADLVVPGPAGDYDFAFRFTGDAGTTFSYCDANGGVYAPAASTIRNVFALLRPPPVS